MLGSPPAKMHTSFVVGAHAFLCNLGGGDMPMFFTLACAAHQGPPGPGGRRGLPLPPGVRARPCRPRPAGHRQLPSHLLHGWVCGVWGLGLGPAVRLLGSWVAVLVVNEDMVR